MSAADSKSAALSTASLILWALIFVWVQLYGKFRSKEIVEISNVYDVAFVIFPTVIALALGRNDIVTKVLKEPKSIFDAVVDYILGVSIGIVLAISLLRTESFSVLSATNPCTTQVFATAKVLATNTCLTSLAISDMSIAASFFTITLIQFFKVALSEEYLMSLIREGLHINKVAISKALIIVASIFTSLHYFAYGISNIMAFVIAFAAGILFTYLYYKRGWITPLAAHGTYNSILDLTVRTGLGGALFTAVFYISIIFGVTLYIARRNKYVVAFKEEVKTL